MRVLVADSCSLTRALVRAFFEPEGWQIDVAADVRQGVGPAQAAHYDCILMDIQMPELTGVEAIRAIREAGANRQTGIVAYTSDDSGQNLKDLAVAGCDAVVYKPFNRANLVTAVRSAAACNDRDRTGILIPVVTGLSGERVSSLGHTVPEQLR